MRRREAAGGAEVNSDDEAGFDDLLESPNSPSRQATASASFISY
jgi:hypothetical protein